MLTAQEIATSVFQEREIRESTAILKQVQVHYLSGSVLCKMDYLQHKVSAPCKIRNHVASCISYPLNHQARFVFTQPTNSV